MPNPCVNSVFQNPQLKLVCIDADDTLWYDSTYFRRVEESLIACCASKQADPRDVLVLLERTRKSNPQGERGFAAAVVQVSKSLGLADKEQAVLGEELDRFLLHPVEPLPRVKECLMLMRGYKRIVLTKGNEEEQRRKIASCRLDEAVDGIIILPKKSVFCLAEILEQLGFVGREALVIGNSIQHDVIPAIQNGAFAIFLNHDENLHGRNGELPKVACEVGGWTEIEMALTQ